MLYCDDLKIDFKSSKYKILIIEDSKFINNEINKTLTEMGYQCEQALDYATASSKLENSEYDFIILDLNLPDAYGDELVQNIKNISTAKIIILTSENDIQYRESLFKNGILDYLVKDNYFNNSILSIDTIIQSIAKNGISTILIIDDSKFMRKSIEKILKVRNYQVLQAESAEDGFALLKSNPVNLILLDMELPGKHGLELLREIKDIPEYCPLPVMIISGSNDPEVVRSSLKLGASNFIKKPFNIEEFLLKIDIAIKSNRKDREILCKQQLLNEYKDVVDSSSIVSKSDLNGYITYVNDKFCQLTGYTESELMGQPHSIIRHEDMSPEVFTDMWETIQSKKTWHGVVKNRAKNGEAYYVDSFINPIVDYDGNIIEYIAVRTDITEMETMKEHLQKELNISEGNFKEMYKLSSEYEKAIDTSNILSRTDTNGNITYVNKAFCDVSGYTKEELIGKSHSIVRNPKNSKKVYQELWNTITSGDIWNGQLRNRSKSGSSYYVDITIIPIKDADDNILEYMATMRDVTDIIKLHRELEDTQKEVIHKMGEVGETRSKETGFHVKRVAEYSRLLARLANIGEKNANLLYSASPMHDIGKVGIPDSILKKPGKLDIEEWELMQTHCEMGYAILKGSKRPILKAAAIVAYRHHERWDGNGYPNGIAGEKIHIFGRITAIADVFDALGSDRCYKEAWGLEKILAFFKDERAKHFDPNLVNLFLENIDDFLKIRDKFQDQF